MTHAFDHGPRLTDEEYDKRIHDLYEGLPPLPSREQDREIRRRELDLAIDHRLGTGFPTDRREALWAIQERVEKKRLRLAFKYLLRKFFAGKLARDVQGLADYLMDEYAVILTQAELESFFQVQDGVRPVLPIDPNQLKK